MQGKGIRAEKAMIEWPELMRFKRSFTEPVPKHREASFSKAGIAAFHGHARFVGPMAVRVDNDVLTGRHVVVATWAMPANLQIPGTEYVTTSDKFLELNELPPRIVFIGGGEISLRVSHLPPRARSRVTALPPSSPPLS